MKINELGKSLLKRYLSKEITEKEFDKECAYWSLEYLSDYKVKPYPTMPDIVKTFFNDREYARNTGKNFSVKNGFWSEEVCKNWLNQETSVCDMNRSNYGRLLFIYNNLDNKDIVNKRRVWELLEEHRLKDKNFRETTKKPPVAKKKGSDSGSNLDNLTSFKGQILNKMDLFKLTTYTEK